MALTIGERIVFVGLIINFLTTIAGWIFMSRSQRHTQKDVAKLQEQFALNREVRQYTLPDKLGVLNDIVEWFDQGNQLDTDARILLNVHSQSQDKQEYEGRMQTLRLGLRTWQKLQPQYVAKGEQYDPRYPAPKKWSFGVPFIPEDLPQLITAFGWTVAQSVQAVLSVNVYLDQPSENAVTPFYKASLAAIERIKQYIITNTKSDNPQ